LIHWGYFKNPEPIIPSMKPPSNKTKKLILTTVLASSIGFSLGMLVDPSPTGQEHDTSSLTASKPTNGQQPSATILKAGSQENTIRTPIARKKPEPSTGAHISEEEAANLLVALGPNWEDKIPQEATASGPRVLGRPHGDWLLHYEDTDIFVSGAYLLGARVGAWSIHDSDGNLLRSSTYINGKLDGIMRDRGSIADPWYEFEYVNGELIGDDLHEQ
jgi:hypothetical protein